MSVLEKIRDFISGRRYAYTQVFHPSNPHAQEVLEDLAKFCRAHTSTFHTDPRAHAVAEGRREVWLRIQRNLQLTDEQLWALHGAAPSPKRGDSDE